MRDALLKPIWYRTPMPVRNLVRRFRSGEYFRRVTDDYTRFRARTRWIVDALERRPAPAKGTVVIHSLHGYIPSFKEEFIFAALLLWHGYRPVQLVNRNGLEERYTGVLPGVHQIDWRAYAPVPTSPERARARAIMDSVATVRELVAVEVDGCAVGRSVMSAFMRARHLGKVNLQLHADDLTGELAAGLAAIRASTRCLEEVQPTAVLMNERGYAPYGQFSDVALLQGRRTVQYVASHRDDARVFKAFELETRTSHPYSLAPQSWAAALRIPLDADGERAILEQWEGYYRERTWFNFQRLHHRSTLQDSHSIAQQLGLDPGKPTAVIYPHIFSDATFFYGESLYEDYTDWFVDSVRCANRNNAVNWVIKLHPVNVWRYEADGMEEQRYSELQALEDAGVCLAEHVKLIMPDTTISSWSLYQASDFCLTVRGTVGFENAALGKVVIVAGTGHYSGLGFTVEPSSVEEYRDLLLRLPDAPRLSADGRRNALRFGYMMLARKPYRMGNYRMVYSNAPGVFHPLNGELELLETDPPRFFEADAATRWVEWLARGEDGDCLSG